MAGGRRGGNQHGGGKYSEDHSPGYADETDNAGKYDGDYLDRHPKKYHDPYLDMRDDQCATDRYRQGGGRPRRQEQSPVGERRGRARYRGSSPASTASPSPVRRNRNEDAVLEASGEGPSNRRERRGRPRLLSLSSSPPPRKPAPRPRSPSLSPASMKRAKQLLQEAKARDREEAEARTKRELEQTNAKMRQMRLDEMAEKANPLLFSELGGA